MNKHVLLIMLSFVSSFFLKGQAIKYSDAKMFTLLGQLPHCENYERLPKTSEGHVPNNVFILSKYSAGLSLRFRTNSSLINLKWSLLNNHSANVRTGFNQKGFDLYYYEDDNWLYTGTATPENLKDNEATIIENMPSKEREYLLNFPLFDGVVNLEIGIDEEADIFQPETIIIDTINPIVFYGTSITQGSSASRPGMTYCSMLMRHFNKEVINLGFSGNGKMDIELVEYILSASPSYIFLDCTPNTTADDIRLKAPNLLDSIRSVLKEVPIFLIETIQREKRNDLVTQEWNLEQNIALKEVYNTFAEDTNIHYVSSKGIIGTDLEATTDGTHFSDLGFFRMFQTLKREINQVEKTDLDLDSSLFLDTIYTHIYDTVKVSSVDSLIINFKTGVDLVKEKKLKIFPNPTNSNINVLIDDIEDLINHQLLILNNLGQIVYSTNLDRTNIDINLLEILEPGIGYIQIKNAEGGLISKKVILIE